MTTTAPGIGRDARSSVGGDVGMAADRFGSAERDVVVAVRSSTSGVLSGA
jgi:hypothetical protein